MAVVVLPLLKELKHGLSSPSDTQHLDTISAKFGNSLKFRCRFRSQNGRPKVLFLTVALVQQSSARGHGAMA